LLSKVNRATLIDIYYDAAKLIYYKQTHSKKPQLKPKEIARCLNVVFYHQRHGQPVEVTGELLENFGGDFSEERALKYYQERVIGSVQDQLGQTVTIDEAGMDFLYENHEIKSENYRQTRGKRLPWIQYVLRNTKEIYTKQEGNSYLYIYVTKFLLPLKTHTAVTWFLVFTKKRKDIDKSLALLTAIPVDRYNGFLSKLESMTPAEAK
ncbi:MAG: hypothetical protein KGK03_10495, partial [Candidatus Omnitrophica bacterium]|nr:hypothetical protein [Candidatus Omnitrophota bacterium]